MFFEKRISSLPKLLQEIRILDLDSGIRTFGDYAGKKGQFVFLTRSPHDSYVLMVCEKKDGRAPAVGERLLVREFRDTREVEAYLRKLLSRPIDAFVY